MYSGDKFVGVVRLANEHLLVSLSHPRGGSLQLCAYDSLSSSGKRRAKYSQFASCPKITEFNILIPPELSAMSPQIKQTASNRIHELFSGTKAPTGGLDIIKLVY
jgi:hypothetical protein